MKRRQVIGGLFALSVASITPSVMRHDSSGLSDLERNALAALDSPPNDIDPPQIDPIHDREYRGDAVSMMQLSSNDSSSDIPLTNATLDFADEIQASTIPLVESEPVSGSDKSTIETANSDIKHVIDKTINFAHDYDDDVFLSAPDMLLLHSVNVRFKKLQSTIGYGNFNIVSFDDALVFAKRFSQVGAFTAAELGFIEQMFTNDAHSYGFYGDKVQTSLTSSINKDDTFKVPYTGHYLFKDQSFSYYEKLRKHVGEEIILTSGIRSNVKQLHLFLAKAVSVKGNLSRASRSLAPPGYSFHGIGDFDVGRKGWGAKNFTDAFSTTNEFKRMQDLGYVTIRYDHGNELGVRYEPWHIKVI